MDPYTCQKAHRATLQISAATGPYPRRMGNHAITPGPTAEGKDASGRGMNRHVSLRRLEGFQRGHGREENRI